MIGCPASESGKRCSVPDGTTRSALVDLMMGIAADVLLASCWREYGNGSHENTKRKTTVSGEWSVVARPVVLGVCSPQKSRRSPSASNGNTRRPLLSRINTGTTCHPLRGRRLVLRALTSSTTIQERLEGTKGTKACRHCCDVSRKSGQAARSVPVARRVEAPRLHPHPCRGQTQLRDQLQHITMDVAPVLSKINAPGTDRVTLQADIDLHRRVDCRVEQDSFVSRPGRPGCFAIS